MALRVICSLLLCSPLIHGLMVQDAAGKLAGGLGGQGSERLRSTMCAAAAEELENEAALATASDGQALPGLPLIRARLVFLVHRKTGYVMSGRVASCINRVHGEETALSRVFRSTDHWPDDSPTKLIHVARDPLDFLVSSYLYDKITSTEKGTLGRGSAAKFKRRVRRQLYFMGLAAVRNNNDDEFMDVVGDESLREYLARVPEEQGLRVEIGFSWNRLAGISAGRRHCQRMEGRCTQIFLNDIMNSTEQFDTTMRNILDFAGLEATPEVMDCISLQDVHNPVFATSSYVQHCSAKEVTHEQRQQLKDLLIQVDDKYYGGMMQTMSVRWQARSHWTRDRGV